MKKILFLGAFTRRSQAYLQAMVNSELYPAHCIFFGEEAGSQPGQTAEILKDEHLEKYFNPNFEESLVETVKKHKVSYEIISQTSINDPVIHDKLKNSDYDLVIYSGYGAQIVGTKLISLGIPLLHVHTGWLPKYRGSTTFYYSLIEEFRCGVSALFLNEKIDEGKIVAKDNYPPPKGVDSDYSYDSIIRADLLVKILKKYTTQGEFPMNEIQTSGGCTYFVIHPLLKHLSLLKCESN